MEPWSDVTVHRQPVADFLHALATGHAVERLHCEGGGQLIRALAELDVIDEFHVTLAGHTAFGGREAPTATGRPGEFFPASRQFKVSGMETCGDECFLTYLRDRGLPPCEGCGGEATAVVDGKGWCEGCFQARGSCCGG